MGKILVLNCGSSSIKYKLFDELLKPLVSGLVERIGEDANLVHKKQGKKLEKKIKSKNHGEGICALLEMLEDPQWGAIDSPDEITIVGHRVVHGGDLKNPVLATEENVAKVEEFVPLAPLHNPNNLAGIREAKKCMPNAKHVMVFDTAFHSTMPEKAFTYAVPFEYREKYSIRRYGFHGTSHKFVSEEAAKLLGKEAPNLVTCHLGAGASVCAVKAGKSVDTSMGMTPLEGLMMGSRCGDLDAEIIHYLVDAHGFKLDEVYDELNKKSGLLGVSGVSVDVRPIEAKANEGNEQCKLALDLFAYRVAKYVGAYAVAIGGLDALVFTAGIGESDDLLRKKICDYLGILGIELDDAKNKAAFKKLGEIQSSASSVKVFVIPTNEELEIAREAVKVANGG